jgi:ATP-dependent 26S proteasome regulatory subunit
MNLDRTTMSRGNQRLRKFSGADIKADCTEAGYSNQGSRTKVTFKITWIHQQLRSIGEEESSTDYMDMFV